MLLKMIFRECRRAVYYCRGQRWVYARPKGPVARLGNAYGGWTTATTGLNAQSVVYGIGVGTDLSWDLAMIDRFGCTVHAFDPTPRSLAWVEQQTLPASLQFHPLGVAEYDGNLELFLPPRDDYVSFTRVDTTGQQTKVSCPVRKLSTLMQDLGHTRIDVIKLDIEGAEYAVVDDLIASELRPTQLLIEFHHFFDSISVEQTRNALARLRDAGYRIFHSSFHGLDVSLIHESAPADAGTV